MHAVLRVPGTTYYRICIRDNGIGFEAQYAGQIFEVFKRLHGPAWASGWRCASASSPTTAGVLCAESEVGLGSAFCIVLPDRQ